MDRLQADFSRVISELQKNAKSVQAKMKALHLEIKTEREKGFKERIERLIQEENMVGLVRLVGELNSDLESEIKKKFNRVEEISGVVLRGESEGFQEYYRKYKHAKEGTQLDEADPGPQSESPLPILKGLAQHFLSKLPEATMGLEMPIQSRIPMIKTCLANIIDACDDQPLNSHSQMSILMAMRNMLTYIVGVDSPFLSANIGLRDVKLLAKKCIEIVEADDLADIKIEPVESIKRSLETIEKKKLLQDKPAETTNALNYSVHGPSDQQYFPTELRDMIIVPIVREKQELAEQIIKKSERSFSMPTHCGRAV